jgi:SAM-dependent methyltransferase
LVKDLPRYVAEHGLAGRRGFAALEWKGRDLLRGIDFEDGDVLEIGAGEGLLSVWTLYRGARSVVSLEPECAGATEGVGARAATHRQALDIGDVWDYRPDPLQSYQADRRFRVVLSHNSINHLDEPACEQLLVDEKARARYVSLFARIRDLLESGGSFVFADCARVNYWDRAGRPSPFAPEIEWWKHQEPETWCELLREARLLPVSVRWSHPFYRAQHFLGPLLANRTAARCLASWFIVQARAP